MITPEMPTGGVVGQAVLNHEADRHGHDAMGIVSLGSGQIGHVGIEILAALTALVLRVGEMDFPRTTVDKVAEIVQFSGEDLASTAAFVATRTRPMREVSAAFDDLWFGKILRISDSFRGISQIFAGAKHDKVLLDQEFLAQRLPHSPQFVMISRR
jgi:hypothetical protein